MAGTTFQDGAASYSLIDKSHLTLIVHNESICILFKLKRLRLLQYNGHHSKITSFFSSTKPSFQSDHINSHNNVWGYLHPSENVGYILETRIVTLEDCCVDRSARSACLVVAGVDASVSSERRTATNRSRSALHGLCCR